MDFDSIFSAYHTLYRGDSDVPDSNDDEYTIGMRLANEAIHHWETYDNTSWKELYTNLVAAGEDFNLTTATQYDTPENFERAGGHVKVLDSDGNLMQLYPIIEPNDVQFRGDMDTYAFFSGSPTEGYQLNINPAPSTALVGNTVDYYYYKKPTEFTTGTDVTEMSNPYFVVHRMLANRFRASRNPYYDDAMRDAENALSKMKMENDSGTWANPFSLVDRSGTQWGQ